MTNENEPGRAPSAGADAMSRELAAALRTLGWTMPKTASEVAAAEARLAREQIVLPESLLDADAVLQRRPGRVLPFRPHAEKTGDVALENLSRAAREGGEIPPDVEQAMREDRERAERERDA
jgi:hypothetical protein